MEPLLWDTSIQGTPPFRAQNSVPENVHISFVFFTSIEGTSWHYLAEFEGTPYNFFLIQKPGFNLHSGDTLAIKKWLNTKNVNTAIVFKTWINSVTYGMLVWGSCGQILFSNLESMHVRAAKIIFNLIRLVYAGQGGSYHSKMKYLRDLCMTNNH